MARATSQRLRPFQADPARCIGCEIKPTDARQDLGISVASREFAKPASLVVDAEFKVIAGARLDEIVDEVLGKFFRVALDGLLAQPGLILWRHELTPRGKPFGLGYGEQVRLVGFSLDLADHGQRHAASPEHPANGHEAHE